MAYVLSIDQSTQGTKSLLMDEKGAVVARADLSHRQIINEQGWVSHDPEEIYANVLKTVRMVVEKAGIDPAQILCMGISNQRETTVAWHKETGKPVCDAIVWQCARATEVCAELEKTGIGEMVRAHTGIPLSPYFPASKLAWILRNVPGAKKLQEQKLLQMGTVDTYLVYKLTGNYKTDVSNASRTQLFNIHTLTWDAEICQAFGMDAQLLATVTDSDAVFGMTDLGGFLAKPIPVCGVLGDSHAALFGQGCLQKGMTKATYGTGSSIMMNIGSEAVASKNGLVTSLAWKYRGQVNYVMEGNLNYTGSVISWLKDDVGLIENAGETEALARQAKPGDTTCLVPAFTGLGAPYWVSDAKAILCGMTRLTGKAEIVRAALDCIALQIHDVIASMEKDTGIQVPVLRVDGGPTKNGYLMQYQADILHATVSRPAAEELSAIGAGYMAGIVQGLYTEEVLQTLCCTEYHAEMALEERKEKIAIWNQAVKMVRSAQK